MQATLTRRRVFPARLEQAEVLSRAVCPCEMLPAGVPGLVRINGVTYTLAYNATLPESGAPVVHGYKLTNTETYKSYDLDAKLDGCDCPDYVFRRGTALHPCCKHLLSIREWREGGKVA